MNSSATSLRVVNGFADPRALASLFAGGVWTYNAPSRPEAATSPTWSVHFCGGRSTKDRSFRDTAFAADARLGPIHDLWSKMKAELNVNGSLIDVFTEGYTYGFEGLPHHDAKPSDRQLTGIVFANVEWKDTWAGELVFFDTSQECISIRPRPGRLVLFDSSARRTFRAPSRISQGLLIALTFKIHLLGSDTASGPGSPVRQLRVVGEEAVV